MQSCTVSCHVATGDTREIVSYKECAHAIVCRELGNGRYEGDTREVVSYKEGAE